MQRFSKNRQAILLCLRSTKTHPTAGWIYEQLKPDHPELSLGTVYRNLSQMKEAGLIRSVGVIAGEEHFDGTVQPHHHAVCICCGKVIDMGEFPGTEEIFSRIRAETGFDIAELQLSGICPECRGIGDEKNTAEKPPIDKKE